LGIWQVVAQQVRIKQKVRVHTPQDKLLDCLMNILAGGHGLVEVNTRVRPDRVLQRAFGRSACAEQSTISDTLNACTPENVQQLRDALGALVRAHSHTYRHDYQARWQLFDIDMTGLRAGRLGEGVEKGYFAQHRNARGRQLGRVIASHYDEIICERLYPGKRQLEASLLELVDATPTSWNWAKINGNTRSCALTAAAAATPTSTPCSAATTRCWSKCTTGNGRANWPQR
jgi:hypothetical protein